MKKKSSLLNNTSPSPLQVKKPFWSKKLIRIGGPIVFLILHALVALLFFRGPLANISADLWAVLPSSDSQASIAKVEKKLAERASNTMIIFARNPDFSLARQATEKLYQSIRTDKRIEQVRFDIKTETLPEVNKLLFDYRYQTLSKDSLELLKDGNIESLSADVWQAISAPVNLGSLDYLEQDPWLLGYRSLRAHIQSGLLGSGSLSVRDGVLAANYEGNWYVMLDISASESGFITETEGNLVTKIQAEIKTITSQIPNTSFVCSGVPFHSYASSVKTQSEIATISTISFILSILLLIICFRSVIPLLSSLITMSIGIAVGMACTLLVFKDVHLFTIVFGTSLIGISIEYSLHYFSEWFDPENGRRGDRIISKIFKGITLGLITTLVSYFAFTLAPFPLLQQIAVFSMCGLLSSYLAVIFIYPLIPPSRAKLKPHRRVFSSWLLRFNERLRGLNRPVVIIVVLLTLAFVVSGFLLLRVDNNVRSFYVMPAQLAQDESLSSKITGLSPSGSYFIIQGTSQEEVLQKEEALTKKLETLKNSGVLSSFLAASRFLPSEARQKQNYTLAGTVLIPASKEQLLTLGFQEKSINSLSADYKAQSTRLLSHQILSDTIFGRLLKSIKVGYMDDGSWYNAVVLFGVKDKLALSTINDAGSGIYFVNKIDSVNDTLASLSSLAILILITSYLVIFVGLLFIYPWQASVRIALVPVLASVITVAVLGISGLPFNLFVVMGLIMVPGTGIDYAIFYREGRERLHTTILSITLSMLTNVFSFGLLAFSQFAATFGVTVGLGVAISFILAPLIGEQDKPTPTVSMLQAD